MKILFLSSWYPTDRNPNLGIFIREHAHAIHCTGNEIVVLAIVINRDKKVYKSTVTDFLDEKGMRTLLIEINSRLGDIIYHLVPLQYLIVKSVFNKRIKTHFNPDIIHSNVIFPAGIIGYWLSKNLKKTHIITEHWSRIKGFITKPILGKWGIKSYQQATAILPVSLFLKNNLIELLPELDVSKIHVIGNVVNADVFTYKEKIPDSYTIRFCAIATWAHKKIPDKLPELFINALAQFQKKYDKKIHLTMIGGGNKIEDLKIICQELNLDTLFTGYIDKKDIVHHLHQCNYLLHASTIETFGVGTVEALMTGTPVICSKVGALPELVNDSNGVLCDNNVDSWLTRLNDITQHEYDKELIANQVSDKYCKKSIGEQISKVYGEVMSGC